MKTETKLLESLLDAIRAALEMASSRPEAAVLSLRAVLCEALRQGVESAYLRYALGQVLAHCGELALAFEQLQQATKLDPLAVPIRDARRELLGRIRASLTHPHRAANDPEVPSLFGLLVDAGEADVPAQMAMVRFELASAGAWPKRTWKC